MKFPRSLRLAHGRFDAVPFLCVLFPMAFFLLFKDLLILPTGTELRMPAGTNVPALHPGAITLPVALDVEGRTYFENQLIAPGQLAGRLAAAVDRLGTSAVVVIHADRRLPYDRLLQVGELARRAGVVQVVLATQPER